MKTFILVFLVKPEPGPLDPRRYLVRSCVVRSTYLCAEKTEDPTLFWYI
jgi:hypothetical protein